MQSARQRRPSRHELSKGCRLPRRAAPRSVVFKRRANRVGAPHDRATIAPHVCPVRRSRQVPRRPRDVRGRQLDAGRARLRQARQGQGRQRPAALRAARSRPSCSPRRSALAADIDLDLAWEFAPEGEFGFADLARDYFDASADAGAAGRRAARACSRRRTTSAALGKGRFSKAPDEIVQGRRCRHRAQEAGRGADRRLGRRARRAAAARRRCASSSTASCSSPTRTRPNTRRWSRRRARTQRAAARPAEGGRRDRLALPVPLAALPVRELPQGHRLRRRCRRPAVKDELPLAPACRPSRSTTRRPPRSTTRCRCRAWAAARCVSASTSRRRAWRSRPAAPLDQVARERLSTVYMPGHKITMLPDDVVQAYTLHRRPRLPGRLALRALRRGRRSQLHRQRDAARARADRRQPAPRPARARGHRSLARPARPPADYPFARRAGVPVPPGART